MSGKVFGWLMKQFDLPSELPPGKSLVELIEDGRLLIENHLGVKSFGSGHIQIITSYGELSVKGDGLEVAYMSKHQLAITGCIQQISFFRGK